MEGNRDGAEMCIDRAMEFLQKGDFENSKKMLLKSLKLYPTPKAQELLNFVQNRGAAEEEPSAKKRKNSEPKKAEQAFKQENKENIEVNKDHLDAVKRLKNCKNYYEMLGVTKEATDSEIKKAYKKLALQLHPDKNKSPGAAEAFKILGNAAGVLTDPVKRKNYDQFGSDSDRISRSHDHTRSGFHSNTFEADISAEELFNMFFGGGTNIYTRRSGRVYRETHSGGHRGANENAQNNTTFLTQIMPVLILIFISAASSFFISDPIYSLHQSSKFPIQRITYNLKVPYYVKENFANEHQGSLRRLEMGVEEEYVTSLRHACYKEKTYRDSLMYKARHFNDRDMYMKAQSQHMPSCDALSQLHQGVGA